MAKTNSSEACSFCGKQKGDALLLVSGIDANICESCIDQAQIILNEEVKTDTKEKFKFTLSNNIKPKEIKHFLDEYIIDQHEAKKNDCCSCLQSLQKIKSAF